MLEATGGKRWIRTLAGHVESKLESRLAELYSTHASGVMRLAYVLTGDRSAAEDLCHEAFVRVGGRLGTLRNPHRASAYLFRTVINLSRGHGRNLQRERRLRRKLPTDPHQTLPDVAQRHQVVSALLRLPHRQRAAIFLRYYEDLSEGQAAEILNCSISGAQVPDLPRARKPAP